jgi:hypothetical protein
MITEKEMKIVGFVRKDGEAGNDWWKSGLCIWEFPDGKTWCNKGETVYFETLDEIDAYFIGCKRDSIYK